MRSTQLLSSPTKGKGVVSSSIISLNPEINLGQVMSFQFQPLIDRMVDKHGWELTVAVQVFEDTKRFLYLCAACMTGLPLAPSVSIDEVWHNFILFTEDYVQFCKSHFGRIIHHRPRRRDDKPSNGQPVQNTLQMAKIAFGNQLSDNWQFNRADGSVLKVNCQCEGAMQIDCSPSTNCQDSDCHDSGVMESAPVLNALDDLNIVLGYENPAVVARLAKEENLSADEAKALFDDTLRFLWLGNWIKFPICPTPRIDLGWHVFLLFTVDYREFCQNYFGQFIDHLPRRPEDKPDGGAMVRMSREYAHNVLSKELGLTLSPNWVYSLLEADGKCCGNCGSGCCKR